MIGAILGAAVTLGSHIAGGIAARKARKREQEENDTAKRQEDARHTREMYVDPTMRASAIYMLNKTAEAARERMRAAKGRGAIMGNADAQVAAAQEANAQGMADATAKIAAENDVRLQKEKELHLQQENKFLENRLAYQRQTANNIADAVKAAGGVAQAIVANNAGSSDGTTTENPNKPKS